MNLIEAFEKLEEPVKNKCRECARKLLEAPYRAVGPREEERVFHEIVLDSLAPALLFRDNPAFARALDFGCGPGIPSIPLALLLSKWNFLGVDSTAKKIRTADSIAVQLEIGNILFRTERLTGSRNRAVDHKTESPIDHSRFQAIFVRGVAPLAQMLEIAESYLEPKGLLFFYSTAEAFSEQSSLVTDEQKMRWSGFETRSYSRPNSERSYVIARVMLL